MKLHFNWLAAKTHSLCRCKSIHNAGWRKMNAEMTSLNLALSIGHPADSQHCLFTLAKGNNRSYHNASKKYVFLLIKISQL